MTIFDIVESKVNKKRYIIERIDCGTIYLLGFGESLEVSENCVNDFYTVIDHK